MTTLKDAFEDLFDNRDLPLDQSADLHFGPDFRQRTNGQWVDRAAFLAGVAHLRDNVERITVTVLDEVIDGHRYAERHLVDLLDAHGQRAVQEVYLFADIDSDGRFARIEEVTLSLDVDETDRQQGNAREPRQRG
jgi:hypothetical protein